MTAHTYGNVQGYSPTTLTNEQLAKLRTGMHACNPGEAVALVRQIDALEASCAVLVGEQGKHDRLMLAAGRALMLLWILPPYYVVPNAIDGQENHTLNKVNLVASVREELRAAFDAK